MNAYAVVGFIIAFGASAFYAAYTVMESRRVAAKVLALQESVQGASLLHHGSAQPTSKDH
jgi:threonine/homoserine efflux transporter RhtA